MERLAFLEQTRFGDKVQIDKMTETPYSKEIRICMEKGNVMQEHTAPGAIAIMVLRGRINLASEGESTTLSEGDMVCFEANVPHSLDAIEQSIVRLTLAKTDSLKRVFTLT